MSKCYLKDYFCIPFEVVPGIHLAPWWASSGSLKDIKRVNFCEVSFLPVPFPDLTQWDQAWIITKVYQLELQMHMDGMYYCYCLFINLFKYHLLTGSCVQNVIKIWSFTGFTQEPFTGALMSFSCCQEASEVLDGCKFCSCTCCYIFLTDLFLCPTAKAYMLSTLKND